MRKFTWMFLLLACIGFAFSASVEAGLSGIWKASDGSNNFYIQTYSAGSCIAIVTPEGEDFYVFLAPTCTNSLVASEYFGKSATLNVEFSSDTAATANLVISGSSTQYTLNRAFDGDCRGVSGGDGTMTMATDKTLARVEVSLVTGL